MEKPDSLIFDMDGTLWDAVDTYAASWNKVFTQMGIDIVVERDRLAGMVGWEGKKVIKEIMPDFDDEKRMTIYKTVNEARHSMIPEMGGIMYDGVIEGLIKLESKYKLFILSNCAAGIIRHFIDWAGIDHLITDEFAHGVNFMPKNHNIHLLKDLHDLKNPVYIGDTAGDGEQSRIANVPFVFVSYGFGQTDDYDLKFDSFGDLTDYFMGL